MDFGDLNDDTELKVKVTNVHNTVNKIRQILQIANQKNIYQTLSTMEKVNYDLFLSYTLNTLYWIYLRTNGINPNNDEIKNELNRIKTYMIKAKQEHERKTIRPRLDKPASKRFVNHSLNVSKESSGKEPPNKKKKFH